MEHFISWDSLKLSNKNACRDALDQLWRDIVGYKLHLTGGIGVPRMIEGFGEEDERPNAIAHD